MVAPITGPYTEEIGGTAPDKDVTYYSWKQGYKQSSPFDLALAYTRRVGSCTKTASCPRGARYVGASPNTLGWWSSTEWNQATSQAYEKLKAKASDRSALGVSLLEAQQSLSMIAKRSLQIARFVRRLNKFDFPGAASELKLAAVPKGVSRKKAFADNYLEFHFGWSPLMSDIYSSVSVLQSPLKTFHLKATAKVADKKIVVTPRTITSSGATYPFPFYSLSEEFRNVGVAGIAMGMDVAVNNPNLWLANQLGLVNPMVLFYEKVPFSFIADWFFNVEQFLSLGTDWLGLSTLNPWTTRFGKSFAKYQWLAKFQNGGGDLLEWATQDYLVQGSSFELQRVRGLTLPDFGLRKFQLFGWRRSLAAASLVTQQMERKIRPRLI